ncbi:MAG: protein kinase domain-containing protein [Wenzhouxiangella sp.]
MTTPDDDLTQALDGTQQAVFDDDAPPIERIGSWRLLKRIGSGGMGEVYLGERADGSYEAKVAIKLLRLDRNNALALERLRAERRILAGLEHPNIARLIDGGELPSGLPWLVMEYVEGEPLDAWCERHQPDLNARIDLLLKICEALAHAHRCLVVHRDLKPSNILVNAAGEPKLLDFGIAKLLSEGEAEGDSNNLATAAMIMTVAYASPEQVMGEPIGTATDIYQLGLIAYELLSGACAQAQASTTRAGALKAIIVDQAPPRPSQAAARQARPPVRPKRLRGDLDTIVLKAIRKEPSRRYGTVEELASDLRCYLQQRPISARPDSLLYRSQRFVQRNRAGVTAAVAVLALLAWGFVQERQLRGEAEQAALAALAAQAESEQERARVSEALAFIERTLARAAPTELGIDLKVVDLLDDAAERVKEIEDPRVQASLYHSLARTQMELGRPGFAEPLLREGLERSEGQLDTLDPERIQLQLLLVEVLHRFTQFAELEVLAGELAEALKVTRGPLDSQTLQARSMVIRAIQYRGDMEQAVALQEALVAEVEAGLGPSPELVTLLRDLGHIYRRANRDQETIDAFNRVVTVREAIGDNDPRAVVWAAFVPLMLDSERARFDQVLAGVGEYRALVVEQLGPDAPHLINADLMELQSLRHLGRFEESVAFGRAAVVNSERRMGADHTLALNLRSFFAQVLGESGRHEEGLAELTATRARLETISGADSPLVLNAMGYEALQLAALGRRAEAMTLLAEARARIREDQSTGFWEHIPHELDIVEARILRASGNLDAALIKARSAFEALSAPDGNEDDSSFRAARELIRILELRGEHEEVAALHARFPLLAQARHPLP